MTLRSISKPEARFSVADNEDAARFLAGIVLDKSWTRDVRLAAYLILFQVCDRSVFTLPNIDVFKIPEDFDIPFLHKCLKERKW